VWLLDRGWVGVSAGAVPAGAFAPVAFFNFVFGLIAHCGIVGFWIEVIAG
jgi:hypothetical protein